MGSCLLMGVKIVPDKPKVRILRLIARLNVGGPAIQAIYLTRDLNRDAFSTALATGSVSKGEGEMDYLAKEVGVEPLIIPCLCRTLNPLRDLAAFCSILRLTLRLKPDIIHTHTAKAGMLGRLAGIAYRWLTRRPLKLIHTYHGHVFSGYFGPFATTFFIWIERLLAKGTDRIVVLSHSQYREICDRYRIGQPQKYCVVSLGLNLIPYFEESGRKDNFRMQYGVGSDELLIGIIGRLTKIKNHQLFLGMAHRLVERNGSRLRFMLIGDGELRPELEHEAQRLGVDRWVVFTGWQRKMQPVYSGLDIVVLTSDNEGTPVTLIEALAAAKPVIATDVGGVKDLLGQPSWQTEGFGIAERGLLVQAKDAEGLTQGIGWLLANPNEVSQMVRRGREFAQHFDLKRLISDLQRIYLDLLAVSI
jgi:glycosyltransferase involved in cell wall biosynthesis